MKDYIAAIIIAGLLVIVGIVLQTSKAYIMAQLEALINLAENAIRGSNLGEEKKKWVLEHFDTQSKILKDWASRAIDQIVAKLNKTGNWLYFYGEGAATNDETGSN